MRSILPLTVLTALDPVLRGTLVSTLLCDVPDIVVVQYDAADDSLTRTVHDGSGVHERVVLPPEGCCLNCALRADAPASLDRVARRLARFRIVLVPPTTFEAGPLLRFLRRCVVGGRPLAGRVRPDGILTGVDLATVPDDLFGDDLLAERGLAVGAADRRAVGEVLAHHVEEATVLATLGDADPAGRTSTSPGSTGPESTGPESTGPGSTGPESTSPESTSTASTVLGHLSRASPIGDLFDLDWSTTLPAAATFATDDATPATADYLDVRTTGAADAAGVWTRVLESWRPLHPGRLREGIGELAAGSQRGRGAFWLPTRPSSACRWDAAGGQLSIGTPRRWSGSDRRTRLVITGVDVPAEVYAEAFDRLLMTDAELAQGLDRWIGVDDGFGPWLGEHDAAA